MALIVEDGTGLATAESPSSVAELDAAIAAMGARGAAWAAASTASKEAAARDASMYLEQQYSRALAGRPEVAGQALSFPRVKCSDLKGSSVASGVVPTAWKMAHAEAALVALTVDLFAPVERGGRIASSSVGPSGPEKVSVSMSWEAGAPAGTAYPRIFGPVASLIQPVGKPLRYEG